MKRQLKFKFENDNYVIKEGNSIVFFIDTKTLKFVSLDFYNGIYKDKSAAIDWSKILMVVIPKWGTIFLIG